MWLLEILKLYLWFSFHCFGKYLTEAFTSRLGKLCENLTGTHGQLGINAGLLSDSWLTDFSISPLHEPPWLLRLESNTALMVLAQRSRKIKDHLRINDLWHIKVRIREASQKDESFTISVCYLSASSEHQISGRLWGRLLLHEPS